jgi:hypothetical protein
MVDVNDVRALKLARSEFSRRGLDISRADMHVSKGILSVRGTITPYQGQKIDDLKHEIDLVTKHLRGRHEIRDVILELAYLS